MKSVTWREITLPTTSVVYCFIALYVDVLMYVQHMIHERLQNCGSKSAISQSTKSNIYFESLCLNLKQEKKISNTL